MLRSNEEMVAWRFEDLPPSSDGALMPEYATVLWDQSFKHYAFYGGRGGGKSWAIARYLLMEGAMRPLRIACCREIQKNISESVYQLLCDQIIELGLQEDYDVQATEIIGKKHDTIFTFHGLWRNPTGLKSMEAYDICWIEEAAGASKTSLRVLIPTFRKNTSKFIWSWNPEYEHDAVEKMFRPPTGGPPPRTALVRVNWEDNPWFPDILKELKDHDYEQDPDAADHVWGGDYIKAIDGAYYAKDLRLARVQGRLSAIDRDPDYIIRTFWDLGRSDATAIWVAQFVGERIHIIDYIEGSGQSPGYYMNELRRLGYDKCECYLPHDGASVHPDNPLSMSYEQQMRSAGFTVKIVPNQGRDAAQQRIDAARKQFIRMHFNEDACKPGLRALGHYHEKIHEKTEARHGPEHDWSSHAADAFGIIPLVYKAPDKKIPNDTPRKRRSQWAL